MKPQRHAVADAADIAAAAAVLCLSATPALAQSISEAASGINKLVDRVLELTHENDA